MKKIAIILTALFVGAFGNVVSAEVTVPEKDIFKLPVIYIEIGTQVEIASGVTVTIIPKKGIDEGFVDFLKQKVGYTFELTRDSVVAGITSADAFIGYVSTDPSGRAQITLGLTIGRDSSTALISLPVGIGQIQISMSNLVEDTLYYDLIRGFADSVGFEYADPGTFRTKPVPASSIGLDIFTCSSDTDGNSTAIVQIRIISNDDATIGYVLVSSDSIVAPATSCNYCTIRYGRGYTTVPISAGTNVLFSSSMYAAQGVTENSSQTKI